MKIASWNVNGIRAVVQKGFYEWVAQNDWDIICIQEPKAFETQIPPEFRYHMREYNRVWHAGERPGYAGVVTFYKKELKLISSKSHFPESAQFHEDGRVVETQFENFTLLNIYFPNGGERADGTEMLSYKLDFYTRYRNYILDLRDAGQKVITTGDFNICHYPIDIARPEENKNSIWFLPIERAEMDKLEVDGFVDAFRHLYPDLADHYTWWSYRAGARPRNVGRRLDYFRVDKDLLVDVHDVVQHSAVEWSDHCPISIDIF